MNETGISVLQKSAVMLTRSSLPRTDSAPWCAFAFARLSLPSSACHTRLGSTRVFAFVCVSKRPYWLQVLTSHICRSVPKNPVQRKDELSVTCEMDTAGSVSSICALADLYMKCLLNKLHKQNKALLEGPCKNQKKQATKSVFFTWIAKPCSTVQ